MLLFLCFLCVILVSEFVALNHQELWLFPFFFLLLYTRWCDINKIGLDWCPHFIFGFGNNNFFFLFNHLLECNLKYWRVYYIKKNKSSKLEYITIPLIRILRILRISKIQLRTLQQLINANDQNDFSMKRFWKNFTTIEFVPRPY